VPSTPRTVETASGLLPTPNTMESLEPKSLDRIVAHNQKARPGRSYLSQNLREQVVYGQRKLDGSPILPTPNARDWKGASIKHDRVPDKVGQTGIETGKKLRLQPAMCEWMMGYPSGWLDFPMEAQSAKQSGEKKPLKGTATPSSLKSQQK